MARLFHAQRWLAAFYASAGITGALLYLDGRWAQILEGDHAAVTGLYGRIARDARHDHVTFDYLIETEGRSALVPADGGESASTFLATGRDGTVSVLKFSPDAGGDFAGRLRELVTGLPRRGYPAAPLLASGQVADLTFWMQERLPGTVVERVPVPAWLIPEVLRLNDAQAGLGDGTRQPSGLIAATLTAGGDGYCVHATLEARPDTRDLLAVVRQTADRCVAAIPERDDFVHYDFTLANLLTTGAGISGVIDINPPALTGDRAFDLATMLFYLYDRHDLRERLRGRALELTSGRALSAYLAHMLLRQVDWSLRHHPGSPSTMHHLHLARGRRRPHGVVINMYPDSPICAVQGIVGELTTTYTDRRISRLPCSTLCHGR